MDENQNRLHGEVLLLPKFSHTLITIILLIWLIVLFTWLLTSSYARKETVLGWLEPPNGVIRVYPQDTGIIKRVFVKEGDKVIEGQPLFVINGDRVLADGKHLEDLLLEEYQSQKIFLSAQLTRAEKIFQNNQTNINQRVLSTIREIELLDEQLASITEEHNILISQTKRVENLKSKGLISSQDVERVMRDNLSIKNNKQQILREKNSLTNKLAQLKIENKLLPENYANEHNKLKLELSNVAQLVARLQGQKSHIIKASQDGIVNNLQVRVGQRILMNNNIPLLTLLPSNSQLNANLLIPVRSAGFISKGQLLDIRYDAFPYQKFGIYSGKLDIISSTVLLPNELMNSPVSIKEPMYRVTATLNQNEVEAYGKNFPLKPGMTLAADVRLSERNLIQWLLEPLYSLKGRI